MWSVVHLPAALINNLAPVKSLPSQGSKDSNNCKRLESSATAITTLEPSSAGAW
jgi:hypothetical protein